jgi:hypothetical protein
MYFFLVIVACSFILNNPTFFTTHVPYLTDNERAQLRNAIEDIRRGLWDTSQVGLNAVLRKVMNERDD